MIRKFLNKTLPSLAFIAALAVTPAFAHHGKHRHPRHSHHPHKQHVIHPKPHLNWAIDVLDYNDQVCGPYLTTGKRDGRSAEIEPGRTEYTIEHGHMIAHDVPRGYIILDMGKPIYDLENKRDLVVHGSGGEYLISVQDVQGNWRQLDYGYNESRFELPDDIKVTTIVKIEATGYEPALIDSVRAIKP
ncbi:MAG: hypothetical protein ABIF40_01725 [archaeon]